jgi:xanthine dehydrogenase YagS FAD-binding subunit
MKGFDFVRAQTPADASARAAEKNVRLIAGGTLLVDLLRLDVERPDVVVDITRLPWNQVQDEGSTLRIGALVKNTDLAYHPLVTKKLPALGEALLSGASPQVRNLATTGGNLLQRTRCAYFRDALEPACNKRKPGSGCAALAGYSRMHAVLGGSEHCIAVHPSDMCVALAAFDAVVIVSGPRGERSIPLVDFHRLPGAAPERETLLEPGELVTHVQVPWAEVARRSAYVKVRDRASFAFALASAAAGLELEGQTIRAARVALGGVGTKPWRCRESEQNLVGKAPSRANFEQAAALALVGAKSTPYNQFKIELARRAIVRALERAAGTT